MKKVIAIVLALSICFSLCACGKSKAATECENLIMAIEEVSVDSGEAIEAAEKAYEALSSDDKESISECAAVLNDAQKTYTFELSKMAKKYDLENVLTEFAKQNGYSKVVMQGEGIGDVQGNPYKLKEDDFYVFNIIVEGRRLGTVEMSEICQKLNLKHVPIIDTEHYLPETMKEMKEEAEGQSVINPDVKREGLVYRSLDGSISFKNVSNSYLLKHVR